MSCGRYHLSFMDFHQSVNYGLSHYHKSSDISKKRGFLNQLTSTNQGDCTIFNANEVYAYYFTLCT